MVAIQSQLDAGSETFRRNRAVGSDNPFNDGGVGLGGAIANDSTPMTLEDVGRRFGLTRERARQIERSALAALREQLAA